jgi:hypothetical protein
LYGLKQSNRLWFITITEFLIASGFFPLPSDPCVLMNAEGDILVLWVDDIAIVSPTLARINAIKPFLATKFEIRDLGELANYLGLNISRDRSKRQLFLAQHSYFTKILQRFRFEDATPAPTPTLLKEVLTANTGTATQNQIQKYQAMLGSVLYAVVWTRPDLAERCSKLGT